MKTTLVLTLAITLLIATFCGAGWVTLDAPGATWTVLCDIDGSNIAGYYKGASGSWHGFLYNGTTWTTLDKPGSISTQLYAIDGDNLVGWYEVATGTHHGVLFNGTWTTLDKPGAAWTQIFGIDGDNLVGNYPDDSGDNHGFLYNGSTWTNIDKPEAFETFVNAIDGLNIVGNFWGSGYHGFLYNGTTWTTIDKPMAKRTYVRGISGDNIVGYYEDNSSKIHGFLYNGTTWTTLDAPGASKTVIYGIDGSNLVGYYIDASGQHGAVCTVPGPVTSAPVACIVGRNQAVAAGSDCQATVTLDGSCSSDPDFEPGSNDDIVEFNWYLVDPCDSGNEEYLGSSEIAECNLPKGENIVRLEVIDTTGASDTNDVTITVVDQTPPQLTVSVSPAVLWPVNHKMVKVTPSWIVSDNCDSEPAVSLVSITSSESDNAKGDGNSSGDIDVDENGDLYLRAERSGGGTGRIYTITWQAVDASGNTTVASAIVTVLHNRGSVK